MRNQVNLPGTTNEHPNWRQRSPVSLEDLKNQPALRSTADIMRSADNAEGPSAPAPTANGVHNLASVVLITSCRDAAGEAIMCAKYSAEWWKKFPDISREISSHRDPSRIVDDLIQETASGRGEILMLPDSAQKSRPETSHAQAQMDERGENDRDFSIDGKMQDVRGVSAVPPEAP
jgi:hypothetical protein